MAPKPKVKAKAPVAAKANAKPKGLQLSAAQWKAYNAAYNAVLRAGSAASKTASARTRATAFQAAVQTLRNSRLQAAYSMQRITAAQHARVQKASIAAFAAKMSMRQSQLAHQNAALQARITADYQRHLQQAVRMQWAYAGEKIYAHQAVMATLDTSQATTIERARWNAAAQTAKAAGTSTSTSRSASRSAAYNAARAKIVAQAQAAGLAAANALPPARPVGRPKGSTKATRTASVRLPIAVHSAKPATPLQRAGRTAPRPAKFGPLCNPRSVGLFGDPKGYDCVAAAIATHLSFAAGYDLSEEEYEDLVTVLGGEPTIAHALNRVRDDGFLFLSSWVLADFKPAVPANGTRLVAGFQIATGAHAALLLSDLLIASWGEVLRLDAVMTPGTQVEEAWDLTWKRRSS